MSRRFGAPLILDLRPGGSGVSASVTPGAASVPVSFTSPTLKQAVGADNFPLCRGIMVKAVTTFDQAASGGSVVYWDELFRAIASYSVNIPKLGLTHDPNVFTGPVAKHICEFFSLGYQYCDYSRVFISASDGDTTITLYTFLPFTNETVEDPEAFWVWVGWLRDMELIVTVAAESALAAVSTGAKIKTPTTLTAWLECYVSPQPSLPAISQWNRYLTPASASSNLALLQKVGMSGNGINEVEKRSRLMALLEVMSPLGLGGATTGDNITSFGCPELNQDITTNIDGFFASFRSAIGSRGNPNAISSSAPAADMAGGMYSNIGNLTSSAFQNNGLKFVPWRFTPLNGRIEYAPKVYGDLTLTRGMTSPPSSGNHLIITNEIRQLTADKKNELQAETGFPSAARQTFSSRPLREEQRFGHGELIRTR